MSTPTGGWGFRCTDKVYSDFSTAFHIPKDLSEEMAARRRVVLLFSLAIGLCYISST